MVPSPAIRWGGESTVQSLMCYCYYICILFQITVPYIEVCSFCLSTTVLMKFGTYLLTHVSAKITNEYTR